jgi:predicted PhzF superfamily epimerase YddE/YHI9
MRAAIYQLDAFTTRRFAGNPAAVVLLEQFLADEVLQQIAAENNLAETAFLVRAEAGEYQIRWLTPTVEVPLCGHATLASAAVVMDQLDPGRDRVVFHSRSGPLPVARAGDGFVMDLPARPSRAVAAPPGLADMLGAEPVEVRVNEFNYLAVLQSEGEVRALTPDLTAIAGIGRDGVIVSAQGTGPYDFVSRYFAPAKGIPEDSVTGGAHCTLVPYWAQRLEKDEFHVFQASSRGGEISCRLAGDRVELGGSCVLYLTGEIEI